MVVLVVDLAGRILLIFSSTFLVLYIVLVRRTMSPPKVAVGVSVLMIHVILEFPFSKTLFFLEDDARLP